MSALPHKGFKVVFTLILMISELRRRPAESLRSGAAVQRCSGAAVQRCSLWPSRLLLVLCCLGLTVDLPGVCVACVSAPLGAHCHSTSLSNGLYLLLFFSARTFPPSSSSLILFMKGPYSIILSPYISVCPSFSPHLSAPWREGETEERGRDGQIR